MKLKTLNFKEKIMALAITVCYFGGSSFKIRQTSYGGFFGSMVWSLYEIIWTIIR
jgi:hypothetical protein